MAHLSDVQTDVILRLHTICGRTQPGSWAFDTAEHAIALALSDRRTAVTPWQLLHDVLSDARRVLRRRSSRRREIVLADPSQKGGNKRADPSSIEDAMDSSTPEDLLVASDIEYHIRVRVGREYPRHGGRCLDGMLAGDTVADTATTAGISQRHVKRIRARIREIASALAFDQAA